MRGLSYHLYPLIHHPFKISQLLTDKTPASALYMGAYGLQHQSRTKTSSLHLEMASYTTFLLSFLIALSLFGHGATARHLLDVEVPEFPHLPELPKFEVPEFHFPEIPKIEVPELPHFPEVPKIEVPEVPKEEKPEVPHLPEIPKVEVPHLPEASKPTLPTIPFPKFEGHP